MRLIYSGLYISLLGKLYGILKELLYLCLKIKCNYY